jgi:hypothetical protein
MKYEVVYVCLGLEIIPSYLRNVLLVELSHYLATNQRDHHQVRFYWPVS